MQQTTNLDLELYEATDNANLLDGYNASMRKIDAHEGTQDGLITLAQSTANSANTAATNATTAAATADAKAVAAQADATTALTQLGGNKITAFDENSWNNLFTIPANSRIKAGSNKLVEGILLEREVNGVKEDLFIGYINVVIGSVTAADAEQYLKLMQFTDYVRPTGLGSSEIYQCLPYGNSMHAQVELGSDGTLLFWFQGTLPASSQDINAIATIITRLAPRT